MNTLQPDTSVTLVIPAGETLSLNGTGTVTNLGTGVVTEVTGVSIYGPFGGADVCRPCSSLIPCR